MTPIEIQQYKSPFGDLTIGVYKDQLCLCDWTYRKMRAQIDERITKELDSVMIERASPLHSIVANQLDAYFTGDLETFDLPLLEIGTRFQKSVWNELKKISFGQTLSYNELSHRLGDPKAIRAVASANGANAISIIVPCHRIIGSDGSLTGYAGGIEAKKKLLMLEDALDTSQLSLF